MIGEFELADFASIEGSLFLDVKKEARHKRGQVLVSICLGPEFH